MKKIMKLFMSAVISDDRTGVCVMILNIGGQYIHLPVVDMQKEGITEHYIILASLLTFLQKYAVRDAHLSVYTDCREIAFEWGSEYAQDGAFCASTADKDVWYKISHIVEGKGMCLSICDGSSLLTTISKIGGVRYGKRDHT